MHKHVDLLVRGEGISHDAFVDEWRSQYVPTVRDVDRVVRYQQVLPTEPEHAEFDGLSELYFETREDLQRTLGGPGSPADEGALPPVEAVLPIGERRTFAGEVTVQKDEVGGDPDGLYQHSAFLVREEGMSHEAFVDYWQTEHTPIARDIEGVVKYDTVIPAEPDRTEFDGVAELYFEELEDLHAALGSEGSRDYDPTREKARRARQDVDNFLAVDERPRLIGRNRVLKDEA